MSNDLHEAIRAGDAQSILDAVEAAQVDSDIAADDYYAGALGELCEAIVAAREPEDTVERWCYWDGTGELATRTMVRKRSACESLCRTYELDDRQVQRVTITRVKP